MKWPTLRYISQSQPKNILYFSLNCHLPEAVSDPPTSHRTTHQCEISSTYS